MSRKMLFIGVVITFLLGLAGPAAAQGPITPQHSDPTWQARYWNNRLLSGAPVLERSEANVNYDWGTGSPAAGVVANDDFSARWTRYIDVTPGTYRFTVTSDDGIRVWVDSNLIIDEWHVHPATTYTADIYLGTGHHLVKVEYFEQGGESVAKVQWTLKGQTPTTGDWKAEYFNNLTLSGSPVLVRREPVVDYAWAAGSPQPGTVNVDNFSARWTRTVDLPAGTYSFRMTVDDGARLWVNGHLLIDAWYEQAATDYSGDIYLPGGDVTIEMQYFERGGLAVAKLDWSRKDGQTPTPPSTGGTVVDNGDVGFVKGGAAGGWRSVAEGYDGDLLWTFNNRSVQHNYNWARWYPHLTAGRYEVFVYIPDRYTTSSQARYWVSHADGYTLRIVDQSATGGQWVSLGTFNFIGTDHEYVSLSDVTYEPYRSRLLAFDAVKWEPR